MVVATEMTLHLASEPSSIARARRTVRELGAELEKRVVDDAELLASELVTNAVRHGRPLIRLTVAVEDHAITVRVFDAGRRRPVVQPDVGPDVPSGRGLLMVDLVATAWGVESEPGAEGKTVWFRLEEREWN